MAISTRGSARPADQESVLWQFGQSLRLASPLALSYIAFIGMTVTDILMMGWLGAEALAAGALAGHMIGILFLVVHGISGAAAPLMARALGAGDPAAARRLLRDGLWLEQFSIIRKRLTGIILRCGKERVALRCGSSDKTRDAATAQKNPAFGGADRLFGCVAMLARCPTSYCAPRLPEMPICTHQTYPYDRELL